MSQGLCGCHTAVALCVTGQERFPVHKPGNWIEVFSPVAIVATFHEDPLCSTRHQRSAAACWSSCSKFCARSVWPPSRQSWQWPWRPWRQLLSSQLPFLDFLVVELTTHPWPGPRLSQIDRLTCAGSSRWHQVGRGVGHRYWLIHLQAAVRTLAAFVAFIGRREALNGSVTQAGRGFPKKRPP